MDTKLDIVVSIDYDEHDELFENIQDHLNYIKGYEDLTDIKVVQKINELNIVSNSSLGFEIYNLNIQENEISLSFSDELKTFVLNELQTTLKDSNYGFHKFVTEINNLIDEYVRSIQLCHELDKDGGVHTNVNTEAEVYNRFSYVTIVFPIIDQISKITNIIYKSNGAVLKISRCYGYNYTVHRLNFEIFLEFKNVQDMKEAILYFIDNKYLQVI